MIFAASGEEISGVNGIELVLPYLGQDRLRYRRRTRKLEMAVAERG